MMKLNDFIGLLIGEFDNKEQYEHKKANNEDFPYARHINNVCNDKIKNLPHDFKGIFMLEESYYENNGKCNSSPHLFLFIEEAGNIKLISYDIPDGYNKETFKHENLDVINYSDLKVSEKFTPAIYSKEGETWQGGSISMFSPVLKFTLFERFSKECLEVSETIEVNGKRTFGYDDPIIYKRIK